MLESYRKFWTGYAKFSGRTTRSDFWQAFLCNFLVGIIISTVSSSSNIDLNLYDIYLLATIIPNLAIVSRRLHDSGKSGWFQSIPLGLSFLSLGIILAGLSMALDGFWDIFMEAYQNGGSYNFNNIPVNSSGTAIIGLGGLVALVAFIFIIVLIIFLCLNTQPFDNKYGPTSIGGHYNDRYNNQYNNNPYGNNQYNNNGQYNNNNQYPPNNNQYNSNNQYPPNNNQYNNNNQYPPNNNQYNSNNQYNNSSPNNNDYKYLDPNDPNNMRE